MKKQILMAVCLLVFLSCSKNDSQQNGNVNSNSNAPNHFTLTIDGKQYVANGAADLNLVNSKQNWQLVTVETNKKNGSAMHMLYVMNTQNATGSFTLDIFTKDGAADGIGEFAIEKCVIGNCGNSFEEGFSGGLAYEVTGGKVIMNKLDNITKEGTITFDVSNGSITKTITGSFIIKNQ